MGEKEADNGDEEDEYSPGEIPNPLMKQYLHFAESALETSNRRVNTNRFVGTLLTGVLALLTLFGPNAENTGQFVAIGLVGASGSFLSYYWIQTIKSYQQLNSAKYKIITKIEEDMMPVEPYADEWRYLQHDSREKPKLVEEPEEDINHPPQTSVERKLISVLGLGYLIVILFAVYGFLVSIGAICDFLYIL